MKRRLQVAMAIVGNSKIILLDEPTLHLDAETKTKVWDIICQAKQSKTVIFTTSDLEEAEQIADRLVFLTHGKVILNMASSELIKSQGIGYRLSIKKSL
jgi:ABC-type multidrug transport system ATPase subunit